MTDADTEADTEAIERGGPAGAPGDGFPPQSLEAEQSVLGGLLLDNSAWPSALGLEGKFFSRAHELTYAAMRALLQAGQPADVITVAEQLRNVGAATEVGGTAYLNALAQSVPSAANTRRYAEIVRERAARRKLASTTDRIARGASGEQAARAAEEALRELREVSAPAPRRFKLLSVADLRAMPPMRWRIHGVLPETGFAAVYGPSGSGKGFYVIHLIKSLATGEPFFGYRTRQARRIIYVVLEGQSGVPKRIAAIESAIGDPFPDNVRFVFEPFRLTSRDDVLGLAAAVDSAGSGDVIVIDTLNRAAPDADENSAHDMGLVIEAVKHLQELVGGLVLLVHHAGKTADKGMRGHSSVHAALDAVIEVTRDATSNERTWRAQKVKDGEDGEVHPFRLRVVDLGDDDDGEHVTSCVIDEGRAEGGQESSQERISPPKTGSNQRIIYDALAPLFRESKTFGKAGAPSIRPCLMLEDALTVVKERVPVEPKRRKERAQEAIRGLVGTGVLGCNEGWIWLV